MKNPKEKKALMRTCRLAVLLVVGAFVFSGCAVHYMKKHAVHHYAMSSDCPERKIRVVDASYHNLGYARSGFWAELDACGNQIAYYCLDQVPEDCWKCPGFELADCFTDDEE